MCPRGVASSRGGAPIHRYPKVLPSRILLRSDLTKEAWFSPNSDEALCILSMPGPPTKITVENACARFLELGVGKDGKGHVVIRSGSLGAYVASRERPGKWIDAFWTEVDTQKIVDVTGTIHSSLSRALLFSLIRYVKARVIAFWEGFPLGSFMPMVMYLKVRQTD